MAMQQVFLTNGNSLESRWRQAFPEAVCVEYDQIAGVESASDSILWLDGSRETDSGSLVRAVRQALQVGSRVVVMRASPAESEAFALLGLGAVGYCHVAAAPAQLQEIAKVIAGGGIWMPPELLRRFVGLSRRLIPPGPRQSSGAESLTEREFAVASLVGRGSSNREIAVSLGVSERTVKAHLSVIFQKMKVRDRVQLALAVNDIPVTSDS